MAPTGPPSSTDAARKRRIFIGGLTNPVTEAQLRQRFQPFGSVSEVDVPVPDPGQPARGFAHLTLEATDSSYKRCMSVYNGAKWAGMVLKIEEAKPSFAEKLAKEREAAAMSAKAAAEVVIKFKAKRKKRRRRNFAELAEDMSLVTDENASTRPGWDRTRYDRAILGTVNVRDPLTRKVRPLDMTKYKSALVKFGARQELPDKSVTDLTWPEEEDVVAVDYDSNEEEWSPRKYAKKDSGREVVMTRTIPTIPTLPPRPGRNWAQQAVEPVPELAPPKPAKEPKEKKAKEPVKPEATAKAAVPAPSAPAPPVNDAITKQLEKEKRKSMLLLSAVLAEEEEKEPAAGVVSFFDEEPAVNKPTATVSFSDSEDEEMEEKEEEEEAEEDEEAAEDAEEDSDGEDSSKEDQNEGEEGQDSESSASEQSDVEEDQTNDPEPEKDEDNSSESSQKAEEMGRTEQQQDPVDDKVFSSSEDSESPSLHTAPSNQPSSPLETEEPKDYKINTDLRSLIFTGSGAPKPAATGVSSLFGAGAVRTRFSVTQALGLEEPEEEEEEEEEEKAQPKPDAQVDMEDEETNDVPVAGTTKTVGRRPLFLHLGHPELDFRRFIPSLPHGSKLFRRQNTEEEIVKQWEEKRGELTLDYKKKHKAAMRRRRKLGLGGDIV